MVGRILTMLLNNNVDASQVSTKVVINEVDTPFVLIVTPSRLQKCSTYRTFECIRQESWGRRGVTFWCNERHVVTLWYMIEILW